jgi:hypothetical protein
MSGSFAYSAEPTLCATEEHQFLNGNFAGDSESQQLVSLCGDSEDNSTNLVMRVGTQEELLGEFSAPRDGKFFLAQQPLSKETTLNIIYYQAGSRTFALANCQGSNCLAKHLLYVFSGSKRTLLLKSDSTQGGWMKLGRSGHILTKEKPLPLQLK